MLLDALQKRRGAITDHKSERAEETNTTIKQESPQEEPPEDELSNVVTPNKPASPLEPTFETSVRQTISNIDPLQVCVGIF